MSATLILVSDKIKNVAHHYINIAPAETIVTFTKPSRTKLQNARMWAMLEKVAENCDWHGMKYCKEDWKDYFFHSLKRSKWMPDESGGYVPVGMHTSTLNKQDHADLTMILEEFCARNEIDLGDCDDVSQAN